MKRFIEKLKKRAERFLVDAKLDFENKEYDLAVFHAEQAAQLFIKARILSFGVEFPKTHEVSKLLKTLKELGVKGVGKLKKENEKIIELLEFAYVSSRYLPFSFSRKEAQAAIRFAKKLRDLLWKE